MVQKHGKKTISDSIFTVPLNPISGSFKRIRLNRLTGVVLLVFIIRCFACLRSFWKGPELNAMEWN